VILSLAVLVALTGCDRRVDDDVKSAVIGPNSSITERVAVMEDAITKKQWTLPGQAKLLARVLRERKEVLECEGSGLDSIITELDDWCAKSDARDGDNDADRAALKTILDDLEPLLKTLDAAAPDNATCPPQK